MSNASEVKFSDRAKYRLRVAAGFVRAIGVRLTVPRDQFYPSMKQHLDSLDVEQREWLRGLVDWVEDYDKAEALGFGHDRARLR